MLPNFQQLKIRQLSSAEPIVQSTLIEAIVGSEFPSFPQLDLSIARNGGLFKTRMALRHFAHELIKLLGTAIVLQAPSLVWLVLSG
jgi:hypothetical protein